LSNAAARKKLDEILVSRQVVLVTGKGGVGKSVVAAALAVRARSLGLKPLLFECDAPARQSLLPKGRPASSDVEECAPGILAINQKSDDAIRDYAAASLPSKAVADLLFENRIARLFLKASPSVSEMALVGRIAILAEKHGADGPVVVDLHATGHAISLLRAPGGIMKVLQKGVLHDRAQQIEALLQDPVRSAFVTVALPEELPVTELLELHEKMRELKAPEGPVVLNGVFREPAPGIGDDVVAHLDAELPANATATRTLAKNAAHDLSALRAWARRSAREEERLKTALTSSRGSLDILTVPFFVDDGTAAELVQKIADHLAAGGEA
jgi:anion-transporting  ArsA/GET3 family ATPase